MKIENIFNKYKIYFVIGVLVVGIFLPPKLPYVNLFAQHINSFVIWFAAIILLGFRWKYLFLIGIGLLVVISILTMFKENVIAEVLGNSVFFIFLTATLFLFVDEIKNKNNMDEILVKTKKSGLIEFIYLSLTIFYNRIESIVKILILNLRSYKIDFSVLLGKHSYLFQSKKNSIKIGKNTRIGFGVRLEAGFDGRILIGNNVLIHDYSFIYAHGDLHIGDNTMISPNVFITDFNHKFPHDKYKHLLKSPKGYEFRKVTIGSSVWIGTHSIILPGINIGNNAVVGAGSVVTKSIPDNVVVIGNPARIVKK